MSRIRFKQTGPVRSFKHGAAGYTACVLMAVMFPLGLRGQEKPLSITGTFSSGYYSTYSRGDGNPPLNYVPLGAKFEMNGYVVSPNFINFIAEPQFNLGPQATDVGFQGGNGIRLQLGFLRKSIVPVTFRYSNIQVEDVFFGGPSQLSGYTQKDRMKDMGVTLQFHRERLPTVTFDWDTSSTNARPDLPGLSNYVSSQERVRTDVRYEIKGWELTGLASRQWLDSTILVAQPDTVNTGALSQTGTQYQASAQRSFLGETGEFNVTAGSLSTRNVLLGMPADLAARYASAVVNFRRHRRLNGSVRANYSSNLASQVLQQTVYSMAALGSSAPNTNVLAPISNDISSFNVDGLTNLTIGHGFSAFAGLGWSTVGTTIAQNSINATVTTASAGLDYANKFHWGSLSGSYSRQLGVGTFLGQSGTTQGDRYRVSAQHQTQRGFDFEASVQGTDDSLHDAQPYTNRNVITDGTVSAQVSGNFHGSIGGGWQWSDFVSTANDFKTNGYTIHAGVNHPRFQVYASLNNTASNSLPFYNQLFDGIGIGTALLTPLQVIPSDNRTALFRLQARPLNKVEVAVTWTRSLQHLDGYISNNFQFLDAYLRYHYRRIELQMGFFRSGQNYLTNPYIMRQRFYLKVSRTAKLL